MTDRRLRHLTEPRLLFRHDQALEDPRDGLTLFGPLDEGSAYGLRPAVIGTREGVARFWRWVEQIRRPIDDHLRSRPLFPGFEAAFGVPFGCRPVQQLYVDANDLTKACHIADRHERVHRAVHLYVDPITAAVRGEDARADVWFVIVPEEVYRYCRPQSNVETALQVSTGPRISPSFGRRLARDPSLFEELNEEAEPFRYQPHFHNQLKAVLLTTGTTTQIVRESTIAPMDFVDAYGRPLRSVGKASEIAWNLCTAAYYKTGARPWKTAAIRSGVCYLGLVFKRDHTGPEGNSSSCGAQMFLDSGDGLVFKGAGGPWFAEESNTYHLDRAAARDLLSKAVAAYTERNGCAPRELFVHGKARFDDAEWDGFRLAVPTSTRLVGVRIRRADDIRAYRLGRHAILRGLAYVRDERTAFLWAAGFIPRLGTYPGREVPRPLLVDVCRGSADIDTVVADVLALTKLNYNACIYGDGEPVTLRFADAVGEILTAGPVLGAPLPFRLYI